MRSPIAPAAVNAGKTHCIHGHEFTPENTYTNPGGKRGCKTCARRRAAERDQSRNTEYMREYRRRNRDRDRERNAKYAREWRKRKRLAETQEAVSS